MTATERLRALLDERGVEWKCHGYENHTWWGDWFAETRPSFNGLFVKVEAVLTPEQAIAATLGRGTCRLHDCGGSFSAVNRPVWRCDCGAFMTQYTDATTYHKPRFCPNCGKRVEVDE